MRREPGCGSKSSPLPGKLWTSVSSTMPPEEELLLLPALQQAAQQAAQQELEEEAEQQRRAPPPLPHTHFLASRDSGLSLQ